jgi:hypothetical protein
MQPNSGGTTDLAFVPFIGRARFYLPAWNNMEKRMMKPEPKIYVSPNGTEGGREQAFPLQEQAIDPAVKTGGRPAVEVFAERLTEVETGAPAPVFVP